MTDTSTLTTDSKPIPLQDISALTNLDANGVLDILVANTRELLKQEFNAGRITASDYAQVFTQSIQSTQQIAVNYLLQSYELGFTIKNLEMDNSIKQQQLDLANQLMPYQISQIKEQVRQLSYVTDNQLPAEVNNLKKQGDLLTQQVTESTYRVTNLLPQELEQAKAQVQLVGAQQDSVIAETAFTRTKDQQLTGELAKTAVELELLRKQSSRADVDLEIAESQLKLSDLEATKVPDQIVLLQAQTKQVQSQTASSDAQTDRILKETSLKLPLEQQLLQKQLDSADTEIALNESRVRISVAEEAKTPVDIAYVQAQIANLGKQNMLLERDYDIKLVQLDIQKSQLDLSNAELDVRKQELENKKIELQTLQAQVGLYQQKVITEKAQTDATVIGEGSVLGRNNEVLKQQADAYVFDKKNRLLKIASDIFVSTYTDGSRTVNQTNKLTDVELGALVKANYAAVDLSI